MGIFIHRGNNDFQRILNGEYVDKTGLIATVSKTLFTENSMSCVTRPRRFGKSMAAKMLCAYYDESCDSRSLFADLEIAQDASFEKHLNKYPVIYIDMTDFITRFRNDDDIVRHIDREVRTEIHAAFPDVPEKEDDDLMALLLRIVLKNNKPFFFIIDEWDAICREFKPGSKGMDSYVNWLRRMFKSVSANTAFAGVYLTGILPIKKYKTESAMNNFLEYSMVEPMNMACYFGFTKDEVRMLAEKHGMDFDELEKWYDGYQIGDEMSMFNPNSVMTAVKSRRCRSFWGSTATFSNVAHYIDMNFEGLKDDIISMLAGSRCFVDPTSFQNDLSEIHFRDDVLTVLIHTGYLSFDWRESECYIPNYEVAGEMVNAVRANRWRYVADALQQSRVLLQATINGDEEAVVRALADAHSNDTSILSYNNENSLACVISIAYYYARNDYHVHREYASGKGFADLVMIPRKRSAQRDACEENRSKNVSKPALIIELKKDKHAKTGIDQIKERCYPQKVEEYSGDILLVGISYDTETKQHTCRIEQWKK
ncbi:MAG: ATP-binding protein [Prevotella sp.]|nr:ATP-binding protein [Prevotella sp.]